VDPVDQVDPVAFLGLALPVVMIAVVAAWVQARRALRIDPVEALRAD
jgi:ABC-type antimicrobial peptide transport system permease subunit